MSRLPHFRNFPGCPGVECGTYTLAALRGIYNGIAYKRGIEFHITTCLAITMTRSDAMFSVIQPGQLPVQRCALKSALHERNPEMSELAENIQSLHSEACRKPEEDFGEQECFLIEYMNHQFMPFW